MEILSEVRASYLNCCLNILHELENALGTIFLVCICKVYNLIFIIKNDLAETQ